MESLLKGVNIVILAKSHNPSIISKDWLFQKEIIKEEEIKGKFVHTPVFSLVEVNGFTFIVDPDRLQIIVKNINPQNIEELPRIARKYIKKLPETPYTAVGFNFIYHLSVKNVKESLTALLSPNKEKFEGLFSGDYQIGGIIHFKFKDYRAKLDIQPLSGSSEININFNFHFDFKGVEEIEDKLKEFSQIKSETEKIIGGLFNA